MHWEEEREKQQIDGEARFESNMMGRESDGACRETNRNAPQSLEEMFFKFSNELVAYSNAKKRTRLAETHPAV